MQRRFFLPEYMTGPHERCSECEHCPIRKFPPPGRHPPRSGRSGVCDNSGNGDRSCRDLFPVIFLSCLVCRLDYPNRLDSVFRGDQCTAGTGNSFDEITQLAANSPEFVVPGSKRNASQLLALTVPARAPSPLQHPFCGGGCDEEPEY